MKKVYLLILAFLLVGGLFEKVSAQGGAGIVNTCGRLQVKNAHVCAENGSQVSLGGMSMFWSGWSPKYYNATTINYLVDNFKTSVIRAAYGVPTHVDPPGVPGPQGDVQDVRNVIEAAIARGVYVIIDWHSEGDLTPYKAQAKQFYSDMIRDYGQYNNVIYEIWNEPTTSPTSTIQGYCQELTNHIRSEEAKYGHTSKLIICGSQTWSQYPNSYSISDPGNNVAYTFHGYFDNEPSHLNQLYTNARAAMDRGNAVFVTEYGAKYCENSNTSQAIQWCQENGISMCAWSVNDKVEPWSIFTNNMDGLTCVGNYYKSKLTTWPTPVITKVYPTSVAINPSTATIPTVGGMTALTKTFLPANTSETIATWTSSNPSIATVSSAGVVTGVAAGTAIITITAKNKDGQNINGTSTITVKNLINVALNKNVTVSSVETGATGSVLGSNAVDGNATTRWSSVASDPQSLQVDLGASYNVSNVSINWEGASAKDYTIQLSANGTSWTTISTQTSMANGARVDNLTVSGIGRYIKMIGTARTSIYGFSIYEFVVLGTPGTLVHPTSVSVSPTAVSVLAGANTTLVATVIPANATDLTVSWFSSNPTIATVSATGVVTGVSAGSATITAKTTDGGLEATNTVSVSNVSCTGLTISPSTLSLAKGLTSQLSASVIPSNATNKNVTYTSSNTAVATVSATGLITAVNTGTANIVATTVDGSWPATCVLTVTNIPPFSVKIEAESFTGKSTAPQSETCSEGGLNMGWIGTSDWMKYAVNIPSTGTYTVNFRVSSPNSTAKVRLDTNAGAIIFGTTNIPYTGGWQNWQTVSVQMTLNGGTYDLGLNALTGGLNINWIEIVSGSINPISVTGVSVATTAAVAVGATSTLTAIIVPSNATNKNVTWSSSNTAVATVNASGIVTGVAAGTANVSVKSVDGNFTAVCTVNVSSSTCPTWVANTNYAIGSVVVYNGQNYTSNNDWNGTAGDPYTATHSGSGWGWVIGGSCSGTSKKSNTSKEVKISEVSDKKTPSLIVNQNPMKDNVIKLSVSGFESLELINLQIFDIIGQVVYSTKIPLNETGEFNLQIPVTEKMKSGIYVVKVQGSVIKYAKLMIE